MQKNRKTIASDEDTLQPEYDFATATRGVTAARYTIGANVVAIDADLLDVFPDAGAVNAALRALAPILRARGGPRRKTGS